MTFWLWHKLFGPKPQARSAPDSSFASAIREMEREYDELVEEENRYWIDYWDRMDGRHSAYRGACGQHYYQPKEQ